MFDTILNDYPRLPGETDASPRIPRAIHATENGILCIPKGDYAIASPLFITNRCSLEMHPAARLIAVAEMDFVLTCKSDKDYVALSLFEPDGSIYDNLGLFLRGGDIDGNGLASCLFLTNAHHFTITNTVFHNGKKYGLCLGNNEDGHIYELICNNIYCKCTKKGLAGNIGIYSGKSDAHFTDCLVVDYTIGMQILGGANRITRCHIWGGTVPPASLSFREWSDLYAQRKRQLIVDLYEHRERSYFDNEVPEMLLGSISFDIQGYENVLDGCYADTGEIGYRICQDTRMVNCDFFNNKLMGMKKSTAIRHEGGKLTVLSCSFRGNAGNEVLYEGSGENVEWIATTQSDMKA